MARTLPEGQELLSALEWREDSTPRRPAMPRRLSLEDMLLGYPSSRGAVGLGTHQAWGKARGVSTLVPGGHSRHGADAVRSEPGKSPPPPTTKHFFLLQACPEASDAGPRKIGASLKPLLS